MTSDINATTGRVALATAALLLSGTAMAQAEIEEITVTATKRETTIQDVPFSINVQTAQDIERSGATNLEEISRNIAGLTVQNLGPGQSQVAIRGVSAGQIVRDQPGVKEQVGVYLDESVISLSLFTPDFDLYDLNRVETLRGPQGTLFGSGSVGGTIRYITNAPDPEAFASSIELNLNTVTDGEAGGHVKGMVNIPLGDTLAVRAVGYTTEYAGFIDARREGGSVDEDVNGGNRTGARIAATWAPNDTWTITPRIIFQDVEADGFNRQEIFNLYANPYTTTRDPIQLGEREQHLLLREEFSDETVLGDVVVTGAFETFDLTFVGSYMDRDILVSRDASALTGSVSADLGFPDAGILLPSNLQDRTGIEQLTTEFRLSSNTDGPWQWLVGFFYSEVDRAYQQRLPTPGYAAVTDATLGAGTSAGAANGYPNLDSPFNSDLPYDIEQTAFFGEVSYDVSDELTLTVGGRFYDFEEVRSIRFGGLFADPTNQRDTTESDGFTPRILASYDVNDNVTLNAQASQGFRLGGVNDPLNVPLCQAEDIETFGSFQDYDDETLWNYEVGVKTVFGNNMTFNAAAFYTDIEDLQATLVAGTCSSRISFNVEDSHTAGVEFELGSGPGEAFQWSVAGSMLESQFDSTVTGGADNAIIGGLEKGNRLASVPEFQIAATGSYNFDTEMFGGSEGYIAATLQHVGDRITQPSDQVDVPREFTSGITFGGATGTDVTSLDLLLDEYTIINLSAGVVKDSWEAVLYINNIGDENANLSFDRERDGRARLGFRTNQPRTIGVTLRMNFDN